MVLAIIEKRGTISRAEIAKETRLSPPAVSVIISELLKKGLILEVGKAPRLEAADLACSRSTLKQGM